MANVKLTKRKIDSLPKATNPRGERYYDEELRCFGLIAYPTGRKSFFVEYGPKGRRKVHVLGPFGVLTLDDARKLASAALAEALKGNDPNQQRQRRKDKEKLTFADWADEYYKEIEKRKKYLKADKRFFKLAKDRWANRPLVSIGVDDIKKVLTSIAAKGTKIEANRWLASIRACLQAAWRSELIQVNPAMRVRPYPENPGRTRILNDDEFKKLAKAVDELTDPHIRAGFVLLIETGARLSEVLKATWGQFDLDAGLWRIPSTKSGRPQTIPISPSAIATLMNLDHQGEYVIPGREKGTRRYDLKRPWEKLAKKCGLRCACGDKKENKGKRRAEYECKCNIDNVGIHDIRRTFGLHVAKTAGLHIASRLLRHTDIKVTERHYAPLGIEDLRTALGRRNAEVVPFPSATMAKEGP